MWSNYTVLSAIRSVVGGGPTGGATQTKPTPLGFTNTKLASLFSEPYNTSKITNCYPYITENSVLPSETGPRHPKTHGPVLGAVLGAVLGFLFTAAALVASWLWYRRWARTIEGPYSYTANDKMLDTLGSMRGKPAVKIDRNGMHEAEGTTIHEMLGKFCNANPVSGLVQSSEIDGH